MMLTDLIPAIDRIYRVAPGRENRAKMHAVNNAILMLICANAHIPTQIMRFADER